MPSYKFFKNIESEKLEENVGSFYGKYHFIQLHSVIVTPFDERFNLRLVIEMEGVSQKMNILLSNLIQGPTNVTQLFFTDGVKSKYKTVPINSTAKKITFKVIPLPTVKDFELTLSLDYSE